MVSTTLWTERISTVPQRQMHYGCENATATGDCGNGLSTQTPITTRES